MTVAVTGASGHLGANLIRSLIAQGRSVRAVTIEPDDVMPPGLADLDLERVQADVTDPHSIGSALEGSEIVFHLAARIAITDWDADAVWECNVEGTRHVAEACLDHGVRRLVHVSSFNAIAPTDRRAVLESEPSSTDPSLPVYARSKAAAEEVVRDLVAQGLDAVIVNPTGMVGPHDHGPSIFAGMLIDLWEGKMPALVAGGVNLVDIRDVASSMIAAEHRGIAGERYLLGGAWLSLVEIAEVSWSLFGTRVPRFVTPLWLAKAAANVTSAVGRVTGKTPKLTDQSLISLTQHRLVLDSRAQDVLGHRPRPIEETLRDTYRWFEDNGYLTGDRSARCTSVDSSVEIAPVSAQRSGAISGQDTTPKFIEST